MPSLASPVHLAFDVLGAMLQKALDSQTIRGIYFPMTEMELLQNMFADDLSAIIRALLKYIL